MDIRIIHSTKNSADAKGLCVVIDVFRAFSTACYAFNKGIKKIIPVRTIEEAFQCKESHPDWLLMGEVDGCKPDNFELSNSPFEVMQHDVSGKTLIHRSSLGTQGLIGAVNADTIITGSFVNFSAIVNYIKIQKPEIVSLLATGSFDPKIIDEDLLCADALKDALENNTYPKDVTTLLKRSKWSKNFFDDFVASHPQKDFELCADIDRFNFVLKYDQSNKLPCLIRFEI